MKYSEMIKFLRENDMYSIQPVIAVEVESQLEVEIPEEEFESVCQTVFDIYMDCVEEPDIWYLVDEELVNRGYKEDE